MRASLGSLHDIVPGGEESAERLESVEVEEPEEAQSDPTGEAETADADEISESPQPDPEPQPQPEEPQPAPEFDRVTEVLGPLEQIVLAADNQIGSLQERVDAESDDVSTRIDEQVREAAVEQRARVVKMREELTDSATQLATRFETMLDILDQAERQLSIQAGDVRVKVTERGRMTVSHEETTEAEPGSKPPPVIEATKAPEPDAPKAKKGIRGWFRRFRGSDA
jgi:hypothetical protein